MPTFPLQRGAATATLPQWVCLSSLPSLVGVWKPPVTFWEEAWSGFSVMGQDLYQKYLKDITKRKPGDGKIDQMWAVVEVEGDALVFDLRDLGEIPYTRATEPR